ncbi:MAG: Calx-beta domain-containing protein, partial [Planctomycetota bacterium]
MQLPIRHPTPTRRPLIDTEITMTATTGSDASPPVEYYFDETSGNPGGSDSGWVTNPVYNDTGLQASTQYTYTVQMRDSLANTGTASAPANATTDPAPDTDPPTPDETSGNPGGTDSGWVTNPVYNDTGLQGSTQYTYTVQMRDSLANTGTASAPANATTDPTPDTDPPTPDPATFASAPAAVSDTEITMTATTGSDASPPVEYFFDETSGNPGGTDSGWVTNPVYNDTGLTASTQYTYTVQMRDSLANTGTASAPANATTDPAPDTDPPTPDPATFASPPAAVSSSEITMTATTGSDASPPVEYFFDETSGNPGGSDSGWVTNPAYNDTGLSPDTQYTYTVQMRDSLANTGTASAPANATTDPAPTGLALQVDAGGCGPLQAGWISMGACGTYTNVDGTGIDVTLATGNPGACQCRNPGGTGTLADVEADLLFADNEQSAPNADFILTLSNLTQGAGYQVLSYHNRSDEGVTTIPNVTVTGATNVTKPSSIVQDHPIMDNPAEITFTAGAGDVVIRYEAPSGGCGGCQVFFNGFELYSTGPTVGFETDASGGLETVTPALLSVVVSNADPADTYTVDFAATGGTATGGGVDYTLVPDTLTFNPGVTQQDISIDIVDDGPGEPDETIIVTLSNVTGPDAVLGITEHTYTISDYLPDVTFDTAASSGSEGVTPADIPVSLTISSDQTITVDYAVTGGTATGGGDDYTLLGTGTLTFDPFVTTQNISLDVVDDPDIEGNETVILTLSNPTNAGLGSITEHTYTIVDNEQGTYWDGLTWFYSGNMADFFVNV